MNGYLNNFTLQIDTLKSVYYELIQPVEEKSMIKNWWLFGGGTALAMYHFNHRKSFDIDIFITEAQLFDFFNPKWFIDDTKLFDTTSYRFDNANHHLQLKTNDDIKVDFLLNESIINQPIKNNIIDLGFDLYYESIEDIIAKKIKYRKKDNLTRDIFDLAVAIENNCNILQNLVDSRFITFNDLEVLRHSLSALNKNQYLLEIDKIEPQTENYLKIALAAKSIICDNIKSIF